MTALQRIAAAAALTCGLAACTLTQDDTVLDHPSRPEDCESSGVGIITVPDVEGMLLYPATRAVEAEGLLLVGGLGVHEGDPVGEDAIVRSQEPPAGELVPEGACVGLRTELVP